MELEEFKEWCKEQIKTLPKDSNPAEFCKIMLEALECKKCNKLQRFCPQHTEAFLKLSNKR